MKNSLICWVYFILAWSGLYLGMGRLSLMWISLSLSIVTYSSSLLPILCPMSLLLLVPCLCSFCLHPGGRIAVASSLRVSFAVGLRALCESVLCWIDFQCIGFCLSAVKSRRLPLIDTWLLCDFCIDLLVLPFPLHIRRKPSATLSWSQALRKKNCNNNCELLWLPQKERVR